MTSLRGVGEDVALVNQERLQSCILAEIVLRRLRLRICDGMAGRFAVGRYKDSMERLERAGLAVLRGRSTGLGVWCSG